MQGSFQSAAMFSDSWNAPMFTAASPKKQRVTCGLPWYFARERRAGRQRDVAADDRVTAEHAVLGVEQVHRPALAARHTAVAAEQLGHDPARVAPLDDRVNVVPVRAEDVVVGLQGGHRAHRDRLLPDREVAEPADLLQRVHLRAALLESAAEQQLPQQLEPSVLRQRGSFHQALVGHVDSP